MLIFYAILALAPGSCFSIDNNDYTTIVWRSAPDTKPTLEQVLNYIASH